MQHNREFVMKMVNAVVKPFKVDEVREALVTLGFMEMTVSEVKGYSRRERRSLESFQHMPKSSISIAVPDTEVTAVVRAILQAAHTGKVGDGRVWVMPIEETYSIRTGKIE